MSLTFLLGGARSGKSSLAVRWGIGHDGPVRFVATCPRIAGDDDLAARIDRHVADRPAWPTDEEAHDLLGALARAGDGDLVIIDCVSLWVSNLLLRGDDTEAIVHAAAEVAVGAARRRGPTIVVSNETGMSVHPETDLGRTYRDLLGRVNQVVAAEASTAMLVVAGRAIDLHSPPPALIGGAGP